MTYQFLENAGVPNPSDRWGTDVFALEAPALPEPWNSEVVGFYYIDKDHPNASDSSDYGWPDQPRITPQRNPWVYQAGERVEWKGQDYTIAQGTWQIKSNGTPTNPVFIKGYNTRLLKTIIPQGQYMVIEGFDLSHKNGAVHCRMVNGENMSFLVVRYCISDGEQRSEGNGSNISAGDTVFTDNTNRRNHLIFYGNTFHSHGSMDLNSSVEDDFLAFSVNQECEWVWVLGNEAYQMGGDSIRVGKATVNDDAYRCSHVFVSDNHWHHNKENAIDIKEADNVVLSNNLCHDFTGSGSASGEGIVVHNDATNVAIVNNIIYNCATGIVNSGVVGLLVYGNIIYDCVRYSNAGETGAYPTGGGVRSWASNSTVDQEIRVFCNTFINVDRPLIFAKGLGNEAKNNIIYNRSFDNGYDIYTEGTAVASTTLENNLVFHDNGNAAQSFDGAVQTDINNFANSTGNLGVAPLLELTPGAAYGTLLAGSPCIDAGADIVAQLDAFSARYDIAGFTMPLFSAADRYGYVRNQGSVMDIGNHESGGAFAPATPKGPINLLVDAVTNSLQWQLTSLNETNVLVYKNGSLLSTLAAGTQVHAIAGIASSVDSYEVEVTNAVGSTKSSAITSDIVSAAYGVVGTIDIDSSRSGLAVRPYAYSASGAITIGEPVYTGTVSGINYSPLSLTLDSAAKGSGYNYVMDYDCSIAVSLDGTGTVEVTVVVISRNGTATAQLATNSTIANISADASEALELVTMTMAISGPTTITLTPTTDDTDHAIGLVAIKEL